MAENFMEQIKLGKLPVAAKLFVTMFLLIVGLGYLMAVLNIQTTIGLSYEGIVNHYKGSEKDPAAYPGMDMPTLTSTTHTHLVAMSLMFFCLGMIFLFSSASGWLKKLIYLFSFGAIPADLGSAWLTKYVAPDGAYLMLVAGGIVGICVLLEILIPLYEMWIKKSRT
ncbi:MAG: hypothetical protein HY762_05995 [Planctomycetes bacterium]|nr:hypothetical protein [Planctomycetota bacterium]